MYGKYTHAIHAGLLLIALIAPFGIYPVFLMKMLCFALYACAFNLLLGYAGLLSFGHAAFFGLAAYTTGHVLKELGLPTPLGLALGTLAAGALGFVVGLLAIRRQGIYFAMITLALSQMVYFFFLQAPFTGGENGLQGIPRGSFFGLDLGNDLTLYYVVLGIFVAAYALIQRTVHSPFGQVLKAIKENEPRAISLGYEVDRYKLLAMVLSASLAGLAGALKSVVLQLASLGDAHWHASGEVVLMTLLGGMGTLLGPVVGAGTVVSLQNYLASSPIGAYLPAPVVLGAIFVICVLAFRRGFVGELLEVLRKSFNLR
ncbi:MAG TPA: branched-chain amino acid ABC transporter permease [Plasticicumulans sp.]|uniref:branched-chain amino acid ABC transporter permease n=1 Tax=Plasticicumulans sp. TaxID=2307179 RepID=UPI002C3C12F1|nr:branched-chain amino acid ABC transporter permease [Plasticicumulans sp.]